MNSIKKFMEIFESKRATASWLGMTAILKECDQYFKNVPASERGVILSILFNERKGLLNFLMNAMEQPHITKDLEGTLIQTLRLLIAILEQFSEDYKPYVQSTMTVLKLALTVKSTWYLKDAAGKTFVRFVEVFKTLDLDFTPVVGDWVKKLHLYSIQERRVLLHVISVIAWHFPQTKAFARSAKTILRQLMADYRETSEGTKKSPQCLAPYVESLCNMLRNFPPGENDTGSVAPLSLYTNLKRLCNSKENQDNKSLMVATIKLLAEHLAIFGDYVYEDYELWRAILVSLVKKGTYGDEATKALRNYYRTVGEVLARKNSSRDKQVFFDLREFFVKSLENDGTSSSELRLTVYGFSQIIEPCKNYMSASGVQEMFWLIAHRTIPLFSREDDETTRYEEIADYQVALSRIIRYLENVTIDQMRSLATLCTLVIKRFPELTIVDQQYAATSLNTTIINVRYTKESLYQDFITNIIYDGIVWSCSHMLLIDAELNNETDEEQQTLQHHITYKDYVPLWHGLVNPENYTSLSENSETRMAALRTVVHEIIATCVSLMNTLNLDITTSKEKSFFHQEANATRIPANEADFRIYLNLVDLYVEILPSIENHLWDNLTDNFLREIVKNSYKNPTISGFYKLANATLTSSGCFSHCAASVASSGSEESYELVLGYLWSTIEALPRYHQELQISCLQLVLNAPEAFVPRIADRTVPAFRIALTLGLTNYEIASTALSALERWHECSGLENERNFVAQVLPDLAMYLQSEESSERLLQDIEETRRRGTSGRSGKRKIVTLVNDDRTIETFQKRILLFLGSLESEITLRYVHERSLKTGATWSKKNLLEYSMPFPDTNLDVFLDTLLPRVVELSLTSGDRSTRLAACEVLHTLVAFLLGKTVHFMNFDKNRFAAIYESLCPVLVRLACDPDDVVTQLYHPLTMQITHWLSSRLMLDSRATLHLVDALFEGLSDETSTSLRDASGIYLAEFVHWSIKQSSDRSLAECPTNIRLIVRRIVEAALDPTIRKRVAAAVAFNHLYRIIRENDEIVDVLWLELLHAFVSSLEDCRDTRIDDSLDHVIRVFSEKSAMFETTNPRRSRPPGFDGVTIRDALNWIIRRCGSLDRNCRDRCIKVFIDLSRTRNGSSPSDAIREFLESQGVRELNEILLGDDYESLSLRNERITSVQRSLDLYVWLIRDRLVAPEILFDDSNPERMIVFQRVDELVRHCLTIVDTESPKEQKSSLDLRDAVRSQALRCETILTLFDFALVLLDSEITDRHRLDLFTDNFFELVARCLARPERLGFDFSNPGTNEKLPLKLELLLEKSMRILSVALFLRMRDALAIEIGRFSDGLFDLAVIAAGKAPKLHQNRVKCLIFLQKCGVLANCKNCEAITRNASDKLSKIFDMLRSEDFGKSVCFHPRKEARTYLESLVELLLIDCDADTMRIVVKLLTGKKQLYRSDMTPVTHGEYFFDTFENVLVPAFLRDIETTLTLLETSTRENPDRVLRTIESIILHLQRKRNECVAIVERCATAIIAKFPVLESIVNNLEHRRNILLNIYAILVRLRRNRLLERDTDLYRWLLREIVGCEDFNYGVRLLEDFLVCLVDEDLHGNPELTAILANLRNLQKVKGERVKGCVSNETTSYLRVLLKLLPITRSTIVLEVLMNFTSIAANAMRDGRVHQSLKLYYKGLRSSSSVMRSLETTYERFMRYGEPSERLDLLRCFLLPSLSECGTSTIVSFFERNMRRIYGTLADKPNSDVHDRKQLFVSKIASYNLMEIMFARVSRDRIDAKDSPITVATRTIDEGCDVSDEKKCSQKIFRSTLPIRQLRAIEGDDREIVRLLHCAAYKCCITIVSTTREEKFYLAVFAENRDRRQTIWENIVDVEKKYDLRQTSKEYPKEREKLVNIRRLENARRAVNVPRFSYVKSYDLATSTLNENICAYDLNAVNIVPRREDENENDNVSLRLEIDDLNEHECMPSICALLRHMSEARIASGNDDAAPPKWMSQFRASMWSEHSNVRLFLLKIVLNAQTIFRPYARFFIEPVTNATYRGLKENDTLNYLITDALMMLVDWREIGVPDTERGQQLAQLTLAYLIERSFTAPTRFIVKYNLSIVELIVDSWHECLRIPELLDERIGRDDRTAVKLILIFLTNRMADKIVEREDVWRYAVKCLPDWKIEEATVLQCYEAIGLILKFSIGNQRYEIRRNEIVEILPGVFRSMQISHPDRLVKCIHALCKACDTLASDFFQFVSSVQLRVEPTNTAKCLEIFSLVVPGLSRENVVKELAYMRFNNLLENKVLSCERECLRLVDQLVAILESEELSELARLVVPYSSHEILEYRQLCHEICVKLYKKYRYADTRVIGYEEIVNGSRKVLLSGLLDPSEEIQKSSFAFWSEATNWRDEFYQRFLDILDTYECGVETNFLQIVTLVLLELTKKAVGCEKKMFEPLHKCAYDHHEISISWRSRNYESRVPLYAPSAASQANRRFTQYSFGTSSYDLESRDNYALRATETPQFVPTAWSGLDVLGEHSREVNHEDAIFAVPKVPEVAKNKTSRRFLADWSDITVEMRKRQELKRTSELEQGRTYLARKLGRVKLRRKYRIGDFPDIEISHATLLGPVQELVKRDTRVCRELLVTLVASLIERSSSESEAETRRVQIASRFTRILRDERKNTEAVAAILEILFRAPGLECPWFRLAEVANNDGLYAQGACLIEQSLMRKLPVSSHEQPPAKKPRTLLPSANVLEKKEKWIQLASLYESMDELDVVLGIFRGDEFSRDLHFASLARAANDWTRAEDCYRRALEVETDEHTRQHCLRGSFECLARLGKWKKLEKEMETRMVKNFDDLLEPRTSESRWMAPWIFRTHIQRILDSRGNEKFVTAMRNFLNGTKSYQILKEHYGEETAILLCAERPEKSRDFLNGSWENVRIEWLRSSPLSVSPRLRAIVKLRGIRDIDGYLRAMANADFSERWRTLAKRWNNSVPSNKDDLLPWDLHTSYRLYLSENLVKSAPASSSQESLELIDDIRLTKIRQMLRLIDCSLSQKNGQLAKRYILRVESELKDCSDQSLVDEFEINAVRFKFFEARTTNDRATSIKNFSSVWRLSHKILHGETLPLRSEIAVRRVISEMSSHLAKVANDKEDFVKELTARTSLAKDIFSERIDFDSVSESLSHYSFAKLQECCKLAPDMADCHLCLAKYCYESISSSNCNEELSCEFVASTLKAMAHGSHEATYYFPCLLKDNILSYDEARRVFLQESPNVETWRFLNWQTQLLSHLATSTATIVLPIVERLMKTYPDAMVYTVRLALDTGLQFRENSSTILKNFLTEKGDYDRFLRALEYVVTPDLFVEHCVREFAENFVNDRARAGERLMEKFYPVHEEVRSLQGESLRKILGLHRSEIEGILDTPESELENSLDLLLKRLRESTRKLRDRAELKYYSPWLNEYVGRDIEVPGQYSTNEKPRPRYNARIVKVESAIKVMRSIRRPIRITILATDGRRYRFLVKFGEDLRLDQRIEQLWDVMNEKLKLDAACAQRRLSIDTYQVFPLTGTLGLIQWIDATKTLGEYIAFTMHEKERNRLREIEIAYEEWIGKAAPGKSPSVRYKEALLKYGANETRSKLNELSNKIRRDALRNTFVSLTTCTESFMTLRRNFTTSYATMCLGQWLLGIGDRHPANTLIKIESGRCLGIDFASAFGAGLDQSVPELVPFRLTPQIRGLIEPFSEYNAMGATMTHVLRALKDTRGSFLASLDVAAHEQLNWQEHVRNLSQGEGNTSEIKWLPDEKLKIVSEKLDGGKPSTITLQQLADRHSDEKYFARYAAIINGTDTDDDCTRRLCGDNNLSPEEQVQCLIEQATDLNVLGRTYVGWAPWL